MSLCLSVPLCFFLVGCSMSDDDDAGSDVMEYVKVGDRLPIFTIDAVNPQPSTFNFQFSTSSLTGETVIVLFHTSCKDCQRELPRLNSYYLQHRDEPGFQMIAISRAEGAESIAEYWAANGLEIPYSPQPDRRIYNLFASSIIPRIYFCTKEGIVTRVFVERIDEEL